MIDLVWNFPLLPGQQEMWSRYLEAAFAESGSQPVESLRPSFRTVEPKLRERAARWLGYPMSRVWMTCGGHHGTLNALMASGLAGTRVAVEGNTYPGFLDQCWMTKTSVVACLVDDEGIVPEALRELCERKRQELEPVHGIFTMPTVQNPLGFVTPENRRVQIVEIAREFHLTIVEDDAYGFMEENAPPSYAELAPERTYYVRGLAKSLAPGVRTGFLIAPENAAASIEAALRCTATGTNVPQNMAALKMCEDGVLDELMKAKRAEGRERNKAARAALGRLCAPGAAAAWHLWVRVPDDAEPSDIEGAIKAEGVMVTNGQWCAAAPEYRHGLRLALGGEIERARTLEGVARVAGVLEGFMKQAQRQEMGYAKRTA
ncbi:MAG TPA: PLP-dependent aminotransferase family protein [Bryocella sp.]|nr:PLP-dependent aminotransferase family protein [Bryocella sp.]